MEGDGGARRGADSVGPTPGAAAEGVSTEADSGSRGGAGRGGRREEGGPKSFLPNFRCLLPPPARAAAAVWGRRRRRRRLRAVRGAQGAGRLPSGHGRQAVGAGSPVPAPPLEGGVRAGCRGGAGTAAAK